MRRMSPEVALSSACGMAAAAKACLLETRFQDNAAQENTKKLHAEGKKQSG
jgi:hypothetical protein